MSGYGSGCPECERCSADDCEAIVFCRSEPGQREPGPVLCEEHDMYATGVYSPAADPFVRPEREAVDAAYWDRTGSTFDAATNSHRRPA